MKQEAYLVQILGLGFEWVNLQSHDYPRLKQAVKAAQAYDSYMQEEFYSRVPIRIIRQEVEEVYSLNRHPSQPEPVSPGAADPLPAHECKPQAVLPASEDRGSP